MRLCTLLIVAACLVYAPTSALACIWDRDTLAMERARFPEVNELIAGYFARHSPVYYQWRLDQVLAIPADQRKPADYDDLAASYDKLGEPQRAVDTMLEKIKRFPDQGVYESQANLGTFYIHNGQLEKGLVHIDKAIAINPDAHFGREVYQKLLVEYVLQQRAAGQTLPLDTSAERAGFAAFVTRHLPLNADSFGGDVSQNDQEIKRAIKGILGMMRFGNYDSPILLEALGDLLWTQHEDHSGVQRLASRAYLKASMEVEDAAAAEAYREKARNALRMQDGVGLAKIEADLTNEIAKGDSFFAQIEADEQAWVRAGKDLDAEFAGKYYDEPAFDSSVSLGDKLNTLSINDQIQVVLIGIAILIGAAFLAGGLFLWRRRVRPA